MKAKFIGGPKDGYVSSRKKMPRSVLFLHQNDGYMVAVDSEIIEGSLDGIECSCYEISAVNSDTIEYTYKMSFA